MSSSLCVETGVCLATGFLEGVSSPSAALLALSTADGSGQHDDDDDADSVWVSSLELQQNIETKRLAQEETRSNFLHQAHLRMNDVVSETVRASDPSSRAAKAQLMGKLKRELHTEMKTLGLEACVQARLGDERGLRLINAAGDTVEGRLGLSADVLRLLTSQANCQALQLDMSQS